MEKHATAQSERLNGKIPARDTSLRAWLVVIGGVLSYFPTFGLLNAFGTFQTYYVEHLLRGTSSSDVAWIGSLQVFFLFIGGMVVGPLFDRFGARTLMVPGTLVHATSLMLTSLCTKYWQLMLAQGVMFGIANTLLFYPTIAAISIWFDRRRGLALGIAVAGSSLGAIFWSMILQYLLDHVGFGWTVRASGFISLGILLPASLLVVERPKEERDAPTPINWKGIMTQAPFIVFSVGMMLVLWGMFIPFFYLPSYGEHNGLPASAANDLLAYLNAGSFAGRLLTGLLADRTGRFNTISLASLCCTVLLYCLHVMETSSSIIAFSVLYGVASGGLISLQPACVAEITPNKDILGVKIGLMMALCSAGGLTGSPIAGALLSNANGQYGSMINFSASILLGGTVIIVLSRFLAAPSSWRF